MTLIRRSLIEFAIASVTRIAVVAKKIKQKINTRCKILVVFVLKSFNSPSMKTVHCYITPFQIGIKRWYEKRQEIRASWNSRCTWSVLQCRQFSGAHRWQRIVREYSLVVSDLLEKNLIPNLKNSRSDRKFYTNLLFFKTLHGLILTFSLARRIWLNVPKLYTVFFKLSVENLYRTTK